MSSEPKPAAKLGMEFVHEFQNLIQKSDRTCRIREISVCLVTSKAELRRSGTPPICDTHDFAHLAIPVHIQVAGMDVVSSRAVYAALVFNSDANTIAVEYVFGDNESSTVTLSWQAEDGRDLHTEITTVVLSHYIDVDVGAANTDCTGKIQHVSRYVELVLDRLRSRTKQVLIDRLHERRWDSAVGIAS